MRSVKKQITELGTLTANQYMKKCSTSLPVREIQTKQQNTGFLKNQIVRNKKSLNPESVEGHVRETRTLITAHGCVNSRTIWQSLIKPKMYV